MPRAFPSAVYVMLSFLAIPHDENHIPDLRALGEALGECHVIKPILDIQRNSFAKKTKAHRFEGPTWLCKEPQKSVWQIRRGLWPALLDSSS